MYVHGYDSREGDRLQDQADTLVELLHHDTRYPDGSQVLEVGCGVGSQTITLALNSPGAQITSIDISEDSLAIARARAKEAGLTSVRFLRADALSLPFATGSFDHVFVCFVLEHLRDPESALAALIRVLKPGGSITVIEGDHGSAHFFPDSKAAQETIRCQVELQRMAGGDANIGRRLFPLLTGAGLADVRVSPRLVYVDSSRPQLVEGFTLRTFTAMIEGVRDAAIAAGMTTPEDFDTGVRDLRRTSEQDGVFCYTFFKGTGARPAL